MDKFKFKLEKVLDMKLRNEEESKREHAKALKAKVDVQKELDYLNSRYKQYSDMHDIEDVVKRKIISSYLNSLHSSIEETTNILYEKQKILDEKQKDLIQKQVERKSLEKLKEKELNLYKKEMESKEQIQNDEYALQSYIRWQKENKRGDSKC